MALRQAGLIFRAEAAASLVITPRVGEGFIVRRIFVANVSASPAHLLLVNDTARVGFFRIAGFGGSHLLSPRAREVANNVRGSNMFDWMITYSSFKGIPVVQGENFTLSTDAGTADIFVLADSYDAADIKATDPNGSHSPDVWFINYGTNLNAISAAGYNKLDNRRNPGEFVQFPFGAAGSALVPSGKKVDLTVLGGQAVGRFVSAGNTANTQYIRPRIGTAPAQTIFDRNDVGFQFIGTPPGSAGADYTSVRSDIPANPDQWATLDDVVADIQFTGNDEFQLQVSTQIVGAGQLNAGDIDLWCLMHVYPG